jgi:hypothetical protein
LAKILSVTSRSSSGFLIISMSAKKSSSSLDEIRLPDEIAFETGVFDSVEDDQEVVGLGDGLVPDGGRLAEERAPREVHAHVHEDHHVQLLQLI